MPRRPDKALHRELGIGRIPLSQWLRPHTWAPLRCETVLRDADGKRCATATATFVPLGPAQALDAIGTEVTDDDATYVRGQDR